MGEWQSQLASNRQSDVNVSGLIAVVACVTGQWEQWDTRPTGLSCKTNSMTQQEGPVGPPKLSARTNGWSVLRTFSQRTRQLWSAASGAANYVRGWCSGCPLDPDGSTVAEANKQGARIVCDVDLTSSWQHHGQPVDAIATPAAIPLSEIERMMNLEKFLYWGYTTVTVQSIVGMKWLCIKLVSYQNTILQFLELRNLFNWVNKNSHHDFPQVSLYQYTQTHCIV